MAIYHFSVSTITRSSGRSSVASAAYRSGNDLINERDGVAHNYAKREGVEGAEIIAPSNSPDWVYDRSDLWNGVEKIERRKDSQLAREITVALPAELSSKDQKELVRGFVKEHFTNAGMVADVAFHAPGREGDQRNHHAHIMLTMRELTPDGFGKKNRDWNSKSKLETWRKGWAEAANKALKQAGHSQKIDHRSLKTQGIDRVPGIHQGPHITAIERKYQKAAVRNSTLYEPVTQLGRQNQRAKSQNKVIEDSQKTIGTAQKILEGIKHAKRAAEASINWWRGLCRTLGGLSLAEEKAREKERLQRQEQRKKEKLEKSDYERKRQRKRKSRR